VKTLASSLCRGSVTHQRTSGPAHGFRYGLFMLLLDLDELDEAEAGLRLFGRSRWRAFCFRAEDHLQGAAQPLREGVERLLRSEGVAPPGGRILLLTHARVLGYVFNPVSFFYCYDQSDRLSVVVAEVNNTFGERHPYVLPVAASTDWRRKKLMHVSPFFSLAGSYGFHLPPPGESGLEARIDLWQGDRRALASRLSLDRRPLTDAALLGALLRYPFMTLQVILGIHWQALRLWLRGAPVFTKPPHDPEAARGEPA
jgi:DUF1365 family protein